MNNQWLDGMRRWWAMRASKLNRAGMIYGAVRY
nr:MAG TPA: hypothetical protein [Caudoviricetes sp.]